MPPGKHVHKNNYLQRGRRMKPVRQGPVSGTDRTMRFGLDGEPITEEIYFPLKDRMMATMPVSIWPLPYDKLNRDLRAFVGDEGQLRADSFMGGSFLPSEHGGRANAASIFNPVLAAQLVQAYSMEGGLIIDPFAGGGTRGIVAGAMGRQYLGIDIRPDEVQRVRDRTLELGLEPMVQIEYDDAARADWQSLLSVKANCLITCPPYWNLEVYSDDPADLSTKPTYEQFLAGISEVIRRSKFGLRNGAVAAWVVGEFRHPETNELIDFPGDVARLHQDHGFWIYDRIIYTHANPQAFWRMGVFDKTRKLIRVHEHVIVAKYGGEEKPSRGRSGPARVSGSEFLGGS